MISGLPRPGIMEMASKVVNFHFNYPRFAFQNSPQLPRLTTRFPRRVVPLFPSYWKMKIPLGPELVDDGK